MLYTGPWYRSIIHRDIETLAAFVQHDERRTKNSAPGASDHLCLLSPTDTVACQNIQSQRGSIGVQIDDVVRGSFVFRTTCCCARSHMKPNGVAEAAVWVEPDWRNRGIGLALLQGGLTAARHAGVRHLVFDGLGVDIAMRRLVRRFSVDFIFTNQDCQAWLDLTPQDEYCTQSF